MFLFLLLCVAFSGVTLAGVWVLVWTCVLSAALCASFTLNCERKTSIEKEKVLHILRNLRSLSMKDLMSVNCWMLQSFIHVLCSTWAAVWNSIPSSLSVITPCLMTQWRRLATGSFLPPLVFPLFTSDTFNHFISCHYLHDKCLYFLLHENERHNIKQ